MNQAIHIFHKDVYHLWRECCLVLVITAILGWAETASLSAGFAEILWMLASAFLIVRLVHAEAISGHNQFWVTRPYRWKSLLTAKILFVLLFVNLPLLIAQVYIVRSAHFRVLSHLYGLLWSQVLMLLCFSIPLFTLAALTAGIAPFLFSAFVLLTLGYISTSGVLNVYPVGFVFLAQAETPLAVWWVSLSLSVAAIAGSAAFAIHRLYRNRQVRLSRMCALLGSVLAGAFYFYTPWPMALAVQSKFSDRTFAKSLLKIALDPSRREPAPLEGRTKVAKAKLILPINIERIGPDLQLQADAAIVRLRSGNGKNWDSGFAGVNQKVTDDGTTQLSLYMLIDRDFFEAEKLNPLTAHASLYLTVFGERKQRAIAVRSGSVEAVDGLRCGTGMLDQLYCRSVFRWPGSRVYARFGESGEEAFTPYVSYSPFAANLDFNPVERHWVSTPQGVNQATVSAAKPLSHFRSDVEFRKLRLADFSPGKIIR